MTPPKREPQSEALIQALYNAAYREGVAGFRDHSPRRLEELSAASNKARSALCEALTRTPEQGRVIEVFLPYGTGEFLDEHKAEGRSCVFNGNTYMTHPTNERATLIIHEPSEENDG